MTFWHNMLFSWLLPVSSFGFVAFYYFAVSTTSSSRSFVFWNIYPFSLPVRFQLLNLAVFFGWFLSFCSNGVICFWPRLTNVCLCFCQKVPCFSLAIMLWSLSSQGRRAKRISSILVKSISTCMSLAVSTI